MAYKVFAFIVLLSLFKNYNCDDLKLKIEDVFVDYVNYTYVDEDTFHVTIDYQTETQSTMDMTIDIIKDFPEDIAMKIKVWGRAFGQYTVPTGINFDLKMCQDQVKRMITPYLVATGHAAACPPTKGKYESHNLSTEVVGLPMSLLPGLRFLVETEMYAPHISVMKARTISMALINMHFIVDETKKNGMITGKKVLIEYHVDLNRPQDELERFKLKHVKYPGGD